LLSIIEACASSAVWHEPPDQGAWPELPLHAGWHERKRAGAVANLCGSTIANRLDGYVAQARVVVMADGLAGAHRKELKDKQLLVLRAELRSNRLNGSGMNKIARSRSATPHGIKRSKLRNRPLKRLSRAGIVDLTDISHGSSVCMTEYLFAARAAIILWTNLAVGGPRSSLTRLKPNWSGVASSPKGLSETIRRTSCSVPYCLNLRCMLFETDKLPLSAGEPVFDIDPYRASIQNLGRRFPGGVRRVAISCLQIN
jgi:hypothetical protein